MSGQKEDISLPSVKSLLVDIDNAAIRMNAMLHTDVFLNVETLTSIRNHYLGQARADLYRIIGAVDVLGNLVGFVRGLGTGMVDFFYEPAQGLVKSPGAFGLGVAKGTYSLVSGIVGGALTPLVNLLAESVLVSHNYLLMVIINNKRKNFEAC